MGFLCLPASASEKKGSVKAMHLCKLVLIDFKDLPRSFSHGFMGTHVKFQGCLATDELTAMVKMSAIFT